MHSNHYVLQSFAESIFLLGEDISEDKDEGILHSKIVKGEGYKTPKDGATCEGKYNFECISKINFLKISDVIFEDLMYFNFNRLLCG